MRRLQNIKKKIAALTVETLCLSFDTNFRTMTQSTWSKSKKVKRFSVHFWTFRSFFKNRGV